MGKWTIDDDYDGFVHVEAKATEVARKWRSSGYERFAPYTAPGGSVKLRVDGVSAHLQHIGTPEAMRDYDAILETQERELVGELKPKPPSKASVRKRLFDRVQQRHGGGIVSSSAEQRKRWVPVQRSAERAPRITFDPDGTLVRDGVRAESRPATPTARERTMKDQLRRAQ